MFVEKLKYSPYLTLPCGHRAQYFPLIFALERMVRMCDTCNTMQVLDFYPSTGVIQTNNPPSYYMGHD